MIQTLKPLRLGIAIVLFPLGLIIVLGILTYWYIKDKLQRIDESKDVLDEARYRGCFKNRFGFYPEELEQ